jgi:hypothetical protein
MGTSKPKWTIFRDENGEIKCVPNEGTGEYFRQHVLELLKEHEQAGAIPTSVRFLFYELVSKQLISKEREKPGQRRDQPVINALTQLREREQIPWNWIVDETRHCYDFRETDWDYSVINRVKSAADYIPNLDPWQGANPLIITESRSLAGILDSIASKYFAGIASTNGQARGFLHTVLAPKLGNLKRPVLYLGDWDLSGGHIEQNTKNVLESAIAKSKPEHERRKQHLIDMIRWNQGLELDQNEDEKLLRMEEIIPLSHFHKSFKINILDRISCDFRASANAGANT